MSLVRDKKDGWVSYGIQAKGVLVEFLGQWKIIFKQVKMSEEKKSEDK